MMASMYTLNHLKWCLKKKFCWWGVILSQNHPWTSPIQDPADFAHKDHAGKAWSTCSHLGFSSVCFGFFNDITVPWQRVSRWKYRVQPHGWIQIFLSWSRWECKLSEIVCFPALWGFAVSQKGSSSSARARVSPSFLFKTTPQWIIS